jgi:hypothetical protein
MHARGVIHAVIVAAFSVFFVRADRVRKESRQAERTCQASVGYQKKYARNGLLPPGWQKVHAPPSLLIRGYLL